MGRQAAREGPEQSVEQSKHMASSRQAWGTHGPQGTAGREQQRSHTCVTSTGE